MLSSFMVSKKQEDICGFGVPELKSVGVAWVNQPSDIRLYVLIAACDVVFVDTNGDAHEHLLRTFSNFAIQAHEVGACQGLEAEVIVAEVAVVDDARV